MEKTSDQLAQELSDLEKELQIAVHHQGVVQNEYNRVRREIITMEGIRYDKKIILDKARFNARRLQSDIKIKTQEFWSTKNSNQ